MPARSSIPILSCAAVLTLLCCGGKNPPSISNLTLKNHVVKVGQTALGSVAVSDPNGLEGLKLMLAYSRGSLVRTEQQVVPDTNDVITALWVNFKFTVDSGSEPGAYTLTAWVVDGTLLSSNELSAQFTVAQ